MRVPEARDASKVLGCQKDEDQQVVLKEKMKGINIVSNHGIRLSQPLSSRRDRSWSRENEIGCILSKTQGIYQRRPS
jgi:hypothetical protein